MSIDQLEHLAADLRREADGFTLDALEMSKQTLGQMARQARDIPHRVLDVAGVEIRIQLTRTKLPTREFYHLSIGSPMLRYVPKALVDRIVAAFMSRPVPFPSRLGNCFQYLEEIQ